VATTAQTAIRHGQGNATANHVTAHTSDSHATHAAAARREGSKSIREQCAAQSGEAGIGRYISREQITRDVRIGQFQKFDERSSFVAGRVCVSITQIPQQQEVELLHAAPAAPRQFAELFVQ
jgi:hypothetical protein